MSESTGPDLPHNSAGKTAPSSPAEQASAVPARGDPPVRRRRRWWLLLLMLLVILGLIAAAPTILSTPWARTKILARYNAKLGNARVDVDDWSLSWFRGTRLAGLRASVDGEEVFRAAGITADVSLWDLLLRDQLKLGRVDVADLVFSLRRYRDGGTNVEKLLSAWQGRPGKRKRRLIRADLAMVVEGTVQVQQRDGSWRSTMVEPANVQIVGTAQNDGPAAWQIELRTLEATIGPVEISLDERIVIAHREEGLSASGAFQVAGQLSGLSGTLEELGWTRSDWRLGGAIVSSQRLRSEGGMIWLRGETGGDVRIGDAKKPRLNEKRVRLFNDIGYSPADDRLLVRNLLLELRQSGAIRVAARGAIKDLSGDCELDGVRGELSYNSPRLHDIVCSLLGGKAEEEVRKFRFGGWAHDLPFVATGRIPRPRVAPGDPHPLEQFAIRGAMFFPSVAYHGLYAQNLELPLELAGGHLRSVYPDRPEDQQLGPPAECNGGFVQLSGIDLLLMGDCVRLSTLRPNLKVLENANVTQELLQFLGEAQPMFYRVERAIATVDLTVERAYRIPLYTPILNPDDPGSISATMSLLDFSTKSGFVTKLAAEIGHMKLSDDGSLPGHIRDAKVAIRKGRIYSDLGLDLGGQVVGFRNADVVLASHAIEKLTLTIPKAMIPLLRGVDSVRDTIEIPIEGTLSDPKLPSIKEWAMKLISPRKVIEKVLPGRNGK